MFVTLTGLPVMPLLADTTNLLPIADTTIHEAIATNNFGGGGSFTAGGRLQGGIARALLKFDIAGQLPAGSTIHSASLTLNVSAVNGPGSTFLLHRVTTEWGEGTGSDVGLGTLAGAGEASWLDRLGPGSPWSSSGGDFAVASSASQTLGSVGAYAFASAGMASDLQNWLDAPGGNFGWLLRSEDETTAGTIRRFTGRLDENNPPQLLVDYIPMTVTPPTPPMLVNLELADSAIRFSFLAESNRTYTVEFRSELTNGNWDTLTNVPAFPADTPNHITNLISGEARFYRVGTP